MKKTNINLYLVLWLCSVPLSASAAGYINSRHADATNGVKRDSTSGYAIGNCAHCHEQHASLLGSEPAPSGGPDNYLGFDAEENLCYGCHQFSKPRSANGSPDDIKAQIDKGGAGGSAHNVASVTGEHRANEDKAELIDLKHIECTDCHNPHEATNSTHTSGEGAAADDSNANLISGVLTSVDGAVVSGWATATWSSSTTYTAALATATMEYQICFKCHSGFNTNYEAWDGFAGTGTNDDDWTDVGNDFSTNNNSFHPVAGPTNATGRVAAISMKTPWKEIGTQTMWCSDCHGSNAATIPPSGDSETQGPHGSTSQNILKGPNTSWPDNSGTLYTLGSGADQTAQLTGLFCMNCHELYSAGNASGYTPWYNEIHLEHSSGNGQQNVACVACHAVIPHGTPLNALITYDGKVPYTYDLGQGPSDGTDRGSLLNFRDDGSWGAADCQVSDTGYNPGGGDGCGTHSGTSGSYETW